MHPSSQQNGFTLIEILVSLGVFIVVVTIAIGSILSVMEANRKTQNFQDVANNIGFILEDISRNARVGSAYHCGSSGSIDEPQNCSEGDSFFAFEPQEGNPNSFDDQFVYRLNEDKVEKSTDGGSTYSDITDSEITVDRLQFYVSNADMESSPQPRVLVMLSGTAGTDTASEDFNIQTTISQRDRASTSSGPAEGTNVEPNPKCPLDPDVPGRILVNMEEQKEDDTYVHKNTCLKYTADQEIPAGEYTVTYVTWDNHCDDVENPEEEDCNNDQAEEQSWIQVEQNWHCGSEGNDLYVSPKSVDIPWDANTQITKWENQTVTEAGNTEASDEITARGGQDADSHIPVCVAFDPQDEESIINIEEF